MRNMSFSFTTAQMKAGTKTVTRRLGWWFLKPGDIVMAVEKGMGLKKGEKVKRLYPIEIISTQKETLQCNIEYDDCIREGFPEMNRHEFVEMFCRVNKCNPDITVNRIEFRKMKSK